MNKIALVLFALFAPFSVKALDLLNSVPLAGSKVPVNMLLISDDSTSMVLNNMGDIIVSEDGKTAYPSVTRNTYNKLKKCGGYNQLAFDVNKTYEPWIGCPGLNGCPVESSSLSSADNFYRWNDDGDSVFEYGECSLGSNPISVSSLSASQRQNYFNWRTYWSLKFLVAKGALGDFAYHSNFRIGFTSINNLTGGKHIIHPVGDLGDVEVISGEREKLLEAIYSETSNYSATEAGGVDSVGTPLRRALHNAGEYFSGNLSGYDSPILDQNEGGDCGHNASILISDGEWNQDYSGTDTVQNWTESTHAWLRASDKDSFTNCGNTTWWGTSNCDSLTLADIAFEYYQRDLAPGVPNQVPIRPGVDLNPGQHMLTYALGFGLTSTYGRNNQTAGAETDETAMPKYPDSSFNWPYPNDEPTSTEDMKHAAWSGRGEFILADSSDSLTRALEGMADNLKVRNGTNSSVSLNSNSIRTNSFIFSTSYSNVDWSGDLKAFTMNSDLSTGELIWSAEEELRGRTEDRVLITQNASGVGVPISSRTYSESPFKEDIDQLGISTPYREAERFFRRDTATEYDTSKLRNRGSQVLGDFVNSIPVYVEHAASDWPVNIDTGYMAYLRSVGNKKPIVAAGSNDGFIHVFDAESGEELLGYMPINIASNASSEGLSNLMSQNFKHRYTADSVMTAADIKIGQNWKRVLIGGLGAGGQGIFALDITETDKYSEDKADEILLWEVAHPEIGNVTGKPKVVKMNNGKWYIAVPNGYNSKGDGQGHILLLDPIDGSIVFDFATLSGSLSNPNGILDLTIRDIDGNGTAEFIYAGDNEGNLWVLNTSSSNTSQWAFENQLQLDSANPSIIVQKRLGVDPKPLFTTKNNQPISTSISVSFNNSVADVGAYPNQILVFGTGRLAAEGDLSDIPDQYVYGLWHKAANTASDVDSGKFKERTLSFITITDSSGDPMSVRGVDNNTSEPTEYSMDESQSDDGWYVRLDAENERIVFDPALVRHVVLMTSLTTDGGGQCSSDLSGYLLGFDLQTGLSPRPAVIDFNNDGFVNEHDEAYVGLSLGDTPSGVARVGNRGIIVTEFDGTNPIKTDPFGLFTKRRSWSGLY